MLRYGILAAMAVLVATPAMAQAPACTPAVPDSELVKSRTLVMSTNPTAAAIRGCARAIARYAR
jgi:polar amino acid transport system substrate-binding protein